MLTVPAKENKVIELGATENELQTKIRALVSVFTQFPSAIHIHNQTKTCNVYMVMQSDGLHLTITNPDDEIFRL